MPKFVDVLEKRREILGAAVKVFSRHGYRGTSLQRVAGAAGMGKSSIYHYFPTRDALFSGLVHHLLEHEIELFTRALEDQGPPAERLRSLIDGVLGLFDEWAKAGPLVIDCLREQRGRRAVRRTFERVREIVAELIRHGQREGQFHAGDPAALATVLVGCLDGLLLQELIEPGVTGSHGVRKTLGQFLERAVMRERR